MFWGKKMTKQPNEERKAEESTSEKTLIFETIQPSLQKTSDENDIEFISTFKMYNKEESGVKPNTLRDIACFDRAKKATHVRIRKGYTKIFFRRKIPDVTLWGRNIIISWNPNEDGKWLPADKAVLTEDVKKVIIGDLLKIQLLNDLLKSQSSDKAITLEEHQKRIDNVCLAHEKDLKQSVLIEDVEKIFEQEKLYIVDGRYFIPAQNIQVKPIWVLQKLKSLKSHS